jgi:hypothetical protein
LYKPAYVLTINIGEEKRREIVNRFHYDIAHRDETERAIAAAAGVDSRDIIIYCPSFGMSLPEAGVLVRTEGGQVMPLSDSNNDEIRILKEKHKALWKFYVLLDRGAWSRHERVQQAAAEYIGTK